MKRKEFSMTDPMTDEEFKQDMMLVNSEKSIDQLDSRSFKKYVAPAKEELL